MGLWTKCQCSGRWTNQWWDDDIGDDASIEACPTHCEVLQAATVISWYVDSVDGPLAHKLEMVLAPFEHQMSLIPWFLPVLLTSL